MKPSPVALLVVSLLSTSAIAAPLQRPVAKQTVVSKEDGRKLAAWRKSMARVRLPHKGCFKTSYPNTEWHEVPCTAAPERSYPPRILYTVGSAVDFSAVVAGHIASATGSFDASASECADSARSAVDPDINPLISFAMAMTTFAASAIRIVRQLSFLSILFSAARDRRFVGRSMNASLVLRVSA